ncbi:MAG: sulfite exporter TauE/SafE family protein [Sphingomonas sp.]|nr:sulfite exporter TauE/SafE family protein [Sphingomonas sp.]
MLVALLIPLGLATLFYAVTLVRAALAQRASPNPEAVVLGAVTNFFDTLGIGCFAPTMAWFRFRRLVPDRLIPCTLIVGHTLPTMVESTIFLVLLGVLVDPALLVGCIVAFLIGGFLGVPLAIRARVWIIQAVVGCGLVLAAFLYALTNLHLMPGGGLAAGLPTPLLITAIVASFVFGVLLNFGIGNYAPTLALLSLMGMDPRLCFPIMAVSAGFSMASTSVKYIGLGEVNLRIVLGMALGGIPAVLVAALVVKSMPIELLRWMVVVIVLYAAITILRAAFAERTQTMRKAASLS